MVEKPEDVTKVVQEFEEIISSNKKHITWLACHQGIIFEKFKQEGKLSNMISEFGVSRSTVSFKIAFVKLINAYPKKEKHIVTSSFFVRNL